MLKKSTNLAISSMSKIKLLTIYPIDNVKQKLGGIEIIIRESIRYAPSDFEIEMVGISTRNGGLKVGEWHNIIFEGRRIKFLPILEVKDPNVRTRIPLTLRFTLSLLRWRHRIDFKRRLLVFHGLEPAYALRDVKEKKILFNHGDIRYFENKYCESRWRKFKKLYYFMEPFFIKQMKKIFVVSQAGCAYYKERYPGCSSHFQFLPVWYDPEIFYRRENVDRQKVLQLYGLPDKKPFILFVGRLELAKDPLLLVNSFSFINKRYPNSLLIVVGEGQLKREMIQRINDLNLRGEVIFLGQKLPAEITQLLNISDLMLLTSAFEGMSKVVLEALACGLPVVATDVGENHLVIKDGISGKLVFSRNPQDIARAAIEIISSSLDASLCQKIVASYSRQRILPNLYSEFRKAQNEGI